jgi:hypothetical protein
MHSDEYTQMFVLRIHNVNGDKYRFWPKKDTVSKEQRFTTRRVMNGGSMETKSEFLDGTKAEILFPRDCKFEVARCGAKD